MLPVIDGYEVLCRLRSGRIDTPILILSGLDEADSKIKGFGIGADDYLTKPFARRELVARVHAMVRRTCGHSRCVINTGRLSVNLDSRPLHLTGNNTQS
jgi:two-component system, cell cycle response regulator CtrA